MLKTKQKTQAPLSPPNMSEANGATINKKRILKKILSLIISLV